MPSRFPEKNSQDNAIKKFKTAIQLLLLAPSGCQSLGTFWPPVRWYLLATSHLVCSGRQSGGTFWPPVDWYYAPADSQLRGRTISKELRSTS
jgi:hypothetical protein